MHLFYSDSKTASEGCKWASERASNWIKKREGIVSLIIFIWSLKENFHIQMRGSFLFVRHLVCLHTEKLLGLCRVLVHQKKGSLHLHQDNLRPSKIVVEIYDRLALKINCIRFRALSSFEWHPCAWPSCAYVSVSVYICYNSLMYAIFYLHLSLLFILHACAVWLYISQTFRSQT